MATLAQLRERISLKLQDPSNTSQAVSAAQVDAEINRSVRFFQNYRFWFNEKKSNITLVASQQAVPSVPSDVISELQVAGLTLIDAQVKINLIKLSPDDFFSRDEDQTGRPYYYTYIDNEYLLLPTPDKAYTLVFRYLEKYADLVNDSDTNDFTNNIEDLLMLHTIKNMYAENKQDPQLAAYYDSLERAELKAVRRRDDSRLASGKLQVNTILDHTYI